MLTQMACADTLNPHDDDPPDLAEYRARLANYIEACKAAGVKAGNCGAYAAMGVSRMAISKWANGKSGAQKQAFAQGIKAMFGMLRETLAQEGFVNPAVAIFWAKNFDDMSDNVVVQAPPESPLGDGLSSQDIADKYKDILED